ncbi:MAG: tetratricopeptide repeat protein [Desulfovibrionaceae bacterium]
MSENLHHQPSRLQKQLRRLEHSSEESLHALYMTAFLAPLPVPYEILEGAFGPGPMPVLNPLARLGLAEIDREDRSYRIGEDLREELLAGLEPDDAAEYAGLAVDAVSAALPGPDQERGALCERLLPHALACVSHLGSFRVYYRQDSRLLLAAGFCFFDQARFSEAEPLFRKALEVVEKTYGMAHVEYLRTLGDLSACLEELGEDDEAESLLVRASLTAQEAFGRDHPEHAVALTNLAGFYMDRDLCEKALPLYRQAMKIDGKTLGEDSVEAARDVNNLATALDRLGRLEEAEDLYRKAWTLYEHTIGPDHADTGVVVNNLAGVLEARGRVLEAGSLYRRRLEILQANYGVDLSCPEVEEAVADYAAFLKASRRAAVLERLKRKGAL